MGLPEPDGPGPAEREGVGLSQMNCRCQMTLAKEREYLRSCNLRHARHKVVLLPQTDWPERAKQRRRPTSPGPERDGQERPHRQ